MTVGPALAQNQLPVLLTASSPAPSTTEERLERYIHAADPITGALGGPVRIMYGVQKLREANRPAAVVEGIDQLAAGTFTTVSGAIGISGVLAAVATDVGLDTIAGSLGKTAASLGGSVVGGWLGGVAAVLKGGTDLVHGIQHHDKTKIICGSTKLGSAALMLAGAMTANPLLVAAGTACYLSTVLIQNHKAMTKPEMGAAAVVIAGAATSNPILVAIGTGGYLAALAIHNRHGMALVFHQLTRPLQRLRANLPFSPTPAPLSRAWQPNVTASGNS